MLTNNDKRILSVVKLFSGTQKTVSVTEFSKKSKYTAVHVHTTIFSHIWKKKIFKLTGCTAS